MTGHDNIRPGASFGPYTLGGLLGRGSTATVYLAHDPEGAEVAVKIRRRGAASQDRRFLREFESMRTLRLPGVVRVFEAGIHDDLLWFSMEAIHGRGLLDAIHDDADPAHRIYRTRTLGKQLLEILARVHEAGFVHRDIKPSNIMVDGADRVHVLDFGIARCFSDSESLSHSGEVLGTVPFMAPEQIASLPLDAKADLFAVGLILYEGIAGRRPRPQTTVGWIPRICLERLPPLATLNPRVPLGLSAVIESLTQVLPHDRPSAANAATQLRRLERGEFLPEWPESEFLKPGPWWTDIEQLLPGPGCGQTWVLDGPAGSGKRRIAEQLHRIAILQGVWPIHVRCRVGEIGAPLVQLLQALVTGLSEGDLASALRDDLVILRRVWPLLPIPGPRGAPEIPLPGPGELAAAAARVIVRAARIRPLLLVFRDLEQVDLVTGRAIAHLALEDRPGFGLLLLHEPRWATRRSGELVESLRQRYGAHHHSLEPWDAGTSGALVASLCPSCGTAPPVRPSLPHQATRAGLAALAQWRGDAFVPPADALWPLAVRDAPVPELVVEHLVGPGVLDSPWVRLTEQGLVLDSATALRLVRAQLRDLRGAARALADAWLAVLPEQAGDEVAHLRLLGEDPVGAWLPVAHSALHAERVGRLADARRWLLLLETLPQDRVSAGHLAFDLAMARARVALGTLPSAPDPHLLEACTRYATTSEHLALAELLGAKVHLRVGRLRPALVNALRLASPARDPSPSVAVRALLTATRCRISLNQLSEARQQLERCEELLASVDDPALAVDVANVRGQLLLLRHDLQGARQISQRTIRAASEAGTIRGIAEATARLGQVLRMLGRRREAEHQARAASEAISATGDITLQARSGLDLATLQVERGDAAGAHNRLDETIRRVRSLNLDHLLPSASRVALQVAIHRADTANASIALEAMRGQDARDSEIPAIQVRWWRTRGDIERVLGVEAPAPRTWGHTLWRLERARAALAVDALDLGRTEAHAGLQDAMRAGLAELRLYARVLLGVLDEVEDTEWARVLRKASASLYTEVYLGALEMDARRRHRLGDADGAALRWRALRARAQELGYRPAVEEAAGWLATP